MAHTAAHRAVVLILDRAGNAVALAKIASDASSLAKLASEAAAIRKLGARLEPPLRPPRLLSEEEGLLLFEPVRWRLRNHPWFLPRALASAIGRFYETEGSPSHGDFAPWNVMATTDGWVLIDWEEAGFDSRGFTDPLHYLVQAHALLGRPRTSELVAGLRGEGWVARALTAYGDAAGLDFGMVEQAAKDYLVSSMQQLKRDPRPRGRGRAIAAREALLDRLPSR